MMLFGWFGDRHHRESERGDYTRWEDKSFRLGMSWFIFSEVMFFAAFFGALYLCSCLFRSLVAWEKVLRSRNPPRSLWSGYTEILAN